MLFSKKPVYQSPGGAYYRLFENMASNPHLLVAGATGSGKSVVINGIILTQLIQHCPDRAAFILIDLKRVELVQYKDCPHTIAYATEPREAVDALKLALAYVDQRCKQMAKQRQRTYTGGDIYVIIDELADLMTTNKREVTPLLQRLCMIGRAARVHLIAGTQRPTTDVIPASITVNIDARVGLRTRCAQDSRNIIYAAGCETLPRYGQGYYVTPEGTTLYNIPMYTDQQINQIVDYWTRRARIA